MRRRVLFSVGLAFIIALVVAAPATAGGWAVTSLDTVPTEFEAGQVYAVGYTIRQHGEKPYVTTESAIEIRSLETGETRVFTGKPDGTPGHYVARVSFPNAGTWEWSVYQGPFEPQDLGTVLVVVPAAAAAAASPGADGPVDASAWRVIFPTLAVLMAGLFAVQFVALARKRRAPERTTASEPATGD